MVDSGAEVDSKGVRSLALEGEDPLAVRVVRMAEQLSIQVECRVGVKSLEHQLSHGLIQDSGREREGGVVGPVHMLVLVELEQVIAVIGVWRLAMVEQIQVEGRRGVVCWEQYVWCVRVVEVPQEARACYVLFPNLLAAQGRQAQS